MMHLDTAVRQKVRVTYSCGGVALHHEDGAVTELTLPGQTLPTRYAKAFSERPSQLPLSKALTSLESCRAIYVTDHPNDRLAISSRKWHKALNALHGWIAVSDVPSILKPYYYMGLSSRLLYPFMRDIVHEDRVLLADYLMDGPKEGRDTWNAMRMYFRAGYRAIDSPYTQNIASAWRLAVFRYFITYEPEALIPGTEPFYQILTKASKRDKSRGYVI